MRDNAAEHQIYMETTVADFKKKIEHLEKLLRSESARRTQIGVTFRAFFKVLTAFLAIISLGNHLLVNKLHLLFVPF